MSSPRNRRQQTKRPTVNPINMQAVEKANEQADQEHLVAGGDDPDAAKGLGQGSPRPSSNRDVK